MRRWANLEKVHKRDVVALSLGLGGHDDVGGSADEGTVASEASAKGEGPRQRPDGDAVDRLHHLHHDRHHRGGEGDVVDEGREDGRRPHNEPDGEVLPRALGDAFDQARQSRRNEAANAK